MENSIASECSSCAFANSSDTDHGLCTTSVVSSVRELYEAFKQNSVIFKPTDNQHAEILKSFLPATGESVLKTLVEYNDTHKVPFDPNEQKSVDEFKTLLAENDKRFFRPTLVGQSGVKEAARFQI